MYFLHLTMEPLELLRVRSNVLRTYSYYSCLGSVLCDLSNLRVACIRSSLVPPRVSADQQEGDKGESLEEPLVEKILHMIAFYY